jgi:hypothetical protein
VINKLLNPTPEKRTTPEELLKFVGFQKFKNHPILGKSVDIGFYIFIFFSCLFLFMFRIICKNCGTNLIEEDEKVIENSQILSSNNNYIFESYEVFSCENRHRFCKSCLEKVYLYFCFLLIS